MCFQLSDGSKSISVTSRSEIFNIFNILCKLSKFLRALSNMHLIVVLIFNTVTEAFVRIRGEACLLRLGRLLIATGVIREEHSIARMQIMELQKKAYFMKTEIFFELP